MTPSTTGASLTIVLLYGTLLAGAAEVTFRHHFVDRELPGSRIRTHAAARFACMFCRPETQRCEAVTIHSS